MFFMIISSTSIFTQVPSLKSYDRKVRTTLWIILTETKLGPAWFTLLPLLYFLFPSIFYFCLHQLSITTKSSSKPLLMRCLCEMLGKVMRILNVWFCPWGLAMGKVPNMQICTPSLPKSTQYPSFFNFQKKCLL